MSIQTAVKTARIATGNAARTTARVAKNVIESDAMEAAARTFAMFYLIVGGPASGAIIAASISQHNFMLLLCGLCLLFGFVHMVNSVFRRVDWYEAQETLSNARCSQR